MTSTTPSLLRGTSNVHYGLNVLNPDFGTLQQIASLGFTQVRLDLLEAGGWSAARQITAARDAGLSPLVIVRDSIQVRDLGGILAGCDVELRNEPDGPIGGNLSPGVYAALVPTFAFECHLAGAMPWVGAVGNLAEDPLTWLQRMLAALPAAVTSFGVTVHRYPNGNLWSRAHEGFGSREHEVLKLRNLIGDRPWACSEFGYTTAPQLKRKWLPRWLPGNTWALTDAQVADNVTHEWDFWRRHGARFAVLYQINDGPNPKDKEHRFGIRTLDGRWKPVAHTVPRIERQAA